MKQLYFTISIIITILAITLGGCSDSSTGPNLSDLTGESETYDILPAGEGSISGTVTFEERYDGFTLITVDLENLNNEVEYTTHIYSNTALEGGELLFELTEVDTSGQSVTVVWSDEEGTTLFYNDLVAINAHLTVYMAEDEQNIKVAQADIGENALTGNTETIELDEVDSSGVKGTMELFERVNGFTLAIIELEGTKSDHLLAVHLYENNNGVQDEPLLIFNEIDGETGMSFTNISELEDGTEFGYEELISNEATINVYHNENDMIVIASGSIVAENDSE